MTHADGFHGLLFGSRFTKGQCLALFSMLGDPPPEIAGVNRAFHESEIAQHILNTFAVNLT